MTNPGLIEHLENTVTHGRLEMSRLVIIRSQICKEIFAGKVMQLIIAVKYLAVNLIVMVKGFLKERG